MAERSRPGAARLLLGALGLAGGASALAAAVAQRRIETAERPPVGAFVEVDGERLHYVERGPADGPPALFVHGNGACLDDMLISGLVDACADRYRCLVPDRPGYGHSKRRLGRRYEPADQAALLAGFLGAVGARRALVVGHSFGALVGLSLALDAAEEAVAGAVLLSGYYFPEERRDMALMGLPATPVIGPALVWTVGPALARRAAPRFAEHMFAPQAVPERLVEGYPFAYGERPSQILATARELGGMRRAAQALGGRIGEARRPVAALHGSADTAIDPSQSERLAAALPDATAALLPDLGHMIHYFAHAPIRAALDEVAERAGVARAPHPR